jgi:hypothetical protein
MKKISTLLALGLASLGIQGASAGLISLYQYDNSLTDTVRGGSGTASLVSGSTAYVAGKVGQAFDFNGSTFMKAPQAAGGLPAFSITSWAYFDSRTEWATIVKNWGAGQVGAFHLGLEPSDFKVSNFLGTTSGTPAVVSGTLIADTWYHVGVTFGPSLTQKLYINGVQVDSDAAAGSIINTSFSQMSMGGKLNDDQNAIAGVNPGWLDGYLDELAFFNQELTGTDMLNIYNAGLVGNSVTTLGFALEPYTDPTAVPEPGQVAASLLLLGGIGGYAFVKRRKAAKPALVPSAA